MIFRTDHNCVLNPVKSFYVSIAFLATKKAWKMMYLKIEIKPDSCQCFSAHMLWSKNLPQTLIPPLLLGNPLWVGKKKRKKLTTTKIKTKNPTPPLNKVLSLKHLRLLDNCQAICLTYKMAAFGSQCLAKVTSISHISEYETHDHCQDRSKLYLELGVVMSSNTDTLSGATNDKE